MMVIVMCSTYAGDAVIAAALIMCASKLSTQAHTQTHEKEQSCIIQMSFDTGGCFTEL